MRFGVQLDLRLKQHISQNQKIALGPTLRKFAKDRAKTFIIFGTQPCQEFHIVGRACLRLIVHGV